MSDGRFSSLVHPACAFLLVFLGGLAFVASSDESKKAPNLPVTDVTESDSYLDPRDFKFPGGTRFLFFDLNARGWKLTGTAPVDIEGLRRTVADEMEMRGCGRTRKIELADGEEGALVEWQGQDGGKNLWMFWRAADRSTGFSWGVSK